jgi:DNA-binding transcriptional MerR regulator
MSKAIIFQSQDEDRIYVRSFAARLAGVSEEFIIQCEQEGLITSKQKTEDLIGLDKNSVQRLTLIRRLHRELELDLDTIDLVLHMRRQIIDLQNQIEELERRSRQKERQLLQEMQQLRRETIQAGQIASRE